MKFIHDSQALEQLRHSEQFQLIDIYNIIFKMKLKVKEEKN